MTHSNGSRGKVTAIGALALANIIAAGGEVRRGTRLRSARPEWELQAFNQEGEFVAPVTRRVVNLMSLRVSDKKGINR